MVFSINYKQSSWNLGSLIACLLDNFSDATMPTTYGRGNALTFIPAADKTERAVECVNFITTNVFLLYLDRLIVKACRI